MASQSDDFARMIELLEQILQRLPVQPAPIPSAYGCKVCGSYGINLYACPRSDCPSNVTAMPTTGDYVCPTCVGGTCQCTSGGA